jgi:hypothetical protein
MIPCIRSLRCCTLRHVFKTLLLKIVAFCLSFIPSLYICNFGIGFIVCLFLSFLSLFLLVHGDRFDDTVKSIYITISMQKTGSTYTCYSVHSIVENVLFYFLECYFKDKTAWNTEHNETFCPLYILSFNLHLLITPLIPSNFSYVVSHIQYMYLFCVELLSTNYDWD